MANTKVTGDLIASGTITADNLVSGTLDALLNSYLTTNTYATQGYVTTAVNNLIDAAPASLDTLNELAAALNDDANFATTVTNSLATKLNLSGGTMTGALITTSPLTIQDSTPYIQWKNASGTRLGYIQHNETDLVMSADTGDIILDGNVEINGFATVGTYAAPHYSQSGMAYQVIKATSGSDSQRAMLEVHSGGGGTKGILQAVGVNNTVYVGTLTNSGLIVGNDVVSMAFNTAGNVGINTTSPTKKLDVDGAIRTRNSFNISDGTTQIGGLFPHKVITGSGTDNSTALFAETGLDLHFMTNGSVSSKMVIKSGGNVGIGTTSPEDKLHVANGGLRVSTTANSNHLSIKNIQTSTASTAFEKKIRFLGYNNVEEASIVGLGNQYWGSAYNGIGFNVGTTRRMTINNSGDVNIGNGSSSGSLYFENDVKTRKIVLYSGAGNDNEFYGFGIESNTLVYSTYTANDDHVFFSGYSGGRNELMRVKGSGKIGIGTSSPHSKLHVEGDISQTSNSKTIVFSKTLSDNVGTDIAGFTGFTGDPSAATILVTVVVNASSGYAVETHRYLWNLRKATAGRSRSVTTLTGADQGSVNSGVVSIVSVTPVALYNSYERFRLSVNLSGISTCVVYVKMEALGENIRGLNPM